MYFNEDYFKMSEEEQKKHDEIKKESMTTLDKEVYDKFKNVISVFWSENEKSKTEKDGRKKLMDDILEKIMEQWHSLTINEANDIFAQVTKLRNNGRSIKNMTANMNDICIVYNKRISELEHATSHLNTKIDTLIQTLKEENQKTIWQKIVSLFKSSKK
jgi:hypothetical protein